MTSAIHSFSAGRLAVVCFRGGVGSLCRLVPILFLLAVFLHAASRSWAAPVDGGASTHLRQRSNSRRQPQFSGQSDGTGQFNNSRQADSSAQPAAEPPRLPKKLQVNLAWQIALAANNFSPGIIDGVFGANSRTALREFSHSFFPGHNPFNPHDPTIYNALGVDVRHVIAHYTISNRDAQAVGHLHYHWRAMAAAARMPYSSLADCMCEKFHTTRRLLSRLNPGVDLKKLTVGQTLYVPNIRPFPTHNDFGLAGGLSTAIKLDKTTMPTPKVAYLTINLQQKAIRAYTANNREVALFRCSIPAKKSDYPQTDAVIKNFAMNPNYTFLPSVFHSVHDIHRPLLIPPGPRNPVGVVWMGLSIPNVGMHGNPEPQHIGITGSHGCFRMTNWDAVRLFTLIHIGLPVIIINKAHPIPLTVDLPPGLHPPGVSLSAIRKFRAAWLNAHSVQSGNSRRETADPALERE